MSFINQDGESLRPSFADSAAKGADAAQIAEAVVARWQHIDAALAPIIGARGFASLYDRSLRLTEGLHPWLKLRYDGVHVPPDLVALRSVFMCQSSTDAALGADSLFGSLQQLLTSLVGASLTRRLIGRLPDATSPDPPSDWRTP